MQKENEEAERLKQEKFLEEERERLRREATEQQASLEEQNQSLQAQVADLQAQLDLSAAQKVATEAKLQALELSEAELRAEKDMWHSKSTDLELQLETQKQTAQASSSDAANESSAEIVSLKHKIVSECCFQGRRMEDVGQFFRELLSIVWKLASGSLGMLLGWNLSMVSFFGRIMSTYGRYLLRSST